MALSLTRTDTVGLGGGLKITHGTFTCTAGVNTAATLNLLGVSAIGYGFETNDTAGDVDRVVLTDNGATTGTIQISVECSVAVTDGTFWVLHL